MRPTAEPENDVAVIIPVALIPLELIVTPEPTTVEVNVGVSDNVTVAPIPDADAVKLSLTKLISRTLFEVPTTDPSSLTVIPLIPSPPPPPPEAVIVAIPPLAVAVTLVLKFIEVIPVPTEDPLLRTSIPEEPPPPPPETVTNSNFLIEWLYFKNFPSKALALVAIPTISSRYFSWVSPPPPKVESCCCILLTNNL